ncbi:MAG: hypothetical protein P8J87_20715 [Verrucomicrobiales bacterium]|nr:hypothetical protein [Verrucomicrobiales bacterium]
MGADFASPVFDVLGAEYGVIDEGYGERGMSRMAARVMREAW